jgi:esterase/lipase superfamily enzyme
MGNWVFLNAMGLANIQKRLRAGSLGKVVHAAPDVSKVSFMQWAPVVVSAARNVTVYYSSKDLALDLSSIIHLGRRAGQGTAVQYTPGVDAIDVDNVNSSWIRLGHSAFSASDKVLTDIAWNFLYDIPVWKRSPPLIRKPSAFDYYSNWYFPVQ